MLDLEEIYTEQDARWNQPDEQSEEYFARRRNEFMKQADLGATSFASPALEPEEHGRSPRMLRPPGPTHQILAPVGRPRKSPLKRESLTTNDGRKHKRRKSKPDTQDLAHEDEPKDQPAHVEKVPGSHCSPGHKRPPSCTDAAQNVKPTPPLAFAERPTERACSSLSSVIEDFTSRSDAPSPPAGTPSSSIEDPFPSAPHTAPATAPAYQSPASIIADEHRPAQTSLTKMSRQANVKVRDSVLKKPLRVKGDSPIERGHLSNDVMTSPPEPPDSLAAIHTVATPGGDIDSSNVTTPTTSAPPVAGPSRANNSGAASSSRKNATKPKGKKEKEKLMTPLEYARKLQEKMLAMEKEAASAVEEDTKGSSGSRKTKPRNPKKKIPQFLTGKTIFYVGGDNQWASARTKGRMEFILKHGGTLQATYDPDTITHVVTDDKPFRGATLKALGLSTIGDIPPHVPTVTWSWVLEGYSRAERRKEATEKARQSMAKYKGKGKQKQVIEVEGDGQEVDDWDDVMPHEFLHAAFGDRIGAGSDWSRTESAAAKRTRAKGKGREPEGQNVGDDAPESSRISMSIPDRTAKSNGEGAVTAGLPRVDEADLSHDPLAEFYALAKAEIDVEWKPDDGDPSVQDTSDRDDEPVDSRARKGGWTCDKREVQRSGAVNQDIIDKLEELMQLHKSKPSEEDHWRTFSYGKAIRAIRNYPTRIKSYSDARSIRGVGEKTALKIMEILQTGDLQRIGYEKTKDVEVTQIFQGIYGVGQKTAFMWYASGCRTLEDVKARKGGIKLSPAQEIGLRFYDDINLRMPRSEAQALFDLIKPIVLGIDNNIFVEIMGSFRRGKADCGDIDILITRPTDDGKTHAGILLPLLKALHVAGILTEDLTLPDDAHAQEAVYRGLCRLPNVNGSKRRRIDILTVPWTSRGAALLYYTGDDIFNRAIRLKANVHGYSLNQRGLYAGVVRNPRDLRTKFTEGELVASETEQEIFKILDVPWQEPHERVRG